MNLIRDTALTHSLFPSVPFVESDPVVHVSQGRPSSARRWRQPREEDRWHSFLGHRVPQGGPGDFVRTHPRRELPRHQGPARCHLQDRKCPGRNDCHQLFINVSFYVALYFVSIVASDLHIFFDHQVANMIKGKTPDEIRKTFNIKNDFTPAEEEQVRDLA